MAEREKVIRGLERFIDDFKPYCGNRNDWQRVYDALDLLKEQEAKPVRHIHEEYEKHDWKKDEDGNIDYFAFEYRFCNGPACQRCGYSFCISCTPDGYAKKPYVVDKFVCPSCNTKLNKYEKQKFCSVCGQEVMWDG